MWLDSLKPSFHHDISGQAKLFTMYRSACSSQNNEAGGLNQVIDVDCADLEEGRSKKHGHDESSWKLYHIICIHSMLRSDTLDCR